MAGPTVLMYLLAGLADIFQIGKGGPKIKGLTAAGGSLQARNLTDTGFVPVGVGVPAANEDAVQKQMLAAYPQIIRIPFTSGDFAGVTKDSSTAIPANSIIYAADVQVDTAFPTGTVTVGTTASATLLLAAGDTDLSIAGQNPNPQDRTWGGASSVVRLTFSGAPVSGSGAVSVHYCAVPAS